MKCTAALYLLCLLSQVVSQPPTENVAFALCYPSEGDGGDNVTFVRAEPRLHKRLLSNHHTYELSGTPWVNGQVFQFLPINSTLPQTWYYVIGKDERGKLIFCYPPLDAVNEPASSPHKALPTPSSYRGFRLLGKGTHELCILISPAPIEDWASLVASFAQPTRNFQKQVRKTLGTRLEDSGHIHYQAESLNVGFTSSTRLVPVFLTIYCPNPAP